MKDRALKYGIFLLLLSMLLPLAACGSSKKEDKKDKAEETTSIRDMNPENLDEITMEGIVSDLMGNMSLEEKVGQLFIVSTDNLDFDAETKMTDQMEERLKNYKPGGVVFFGFNLKGRKQLKTFIKKMQATNELPLFMAVDEEGGNVARIANTEKMKTTKFPPMSQIGAEGDTQAARNVGKTIGSEISELGINLDFAPVADVTTNDKNTEIGDRSFGADPKLVSDMVTEVVKGLHEGGVCATLKHFPGQGDSGEDTHRGYVDLDTTIDRLRDVEFLPFEAGIKAGADFVMVSHVSVSSVTGQDVPASLSSLMVNDILRDELQYENVIITDALNMKGITKFYDPDTAAVMAIQAGNDVILMPDNFEEAFQGVLDAVEDGTLSEEQIDRAVARILTVKIRRGILPLSSGLIRIPEESE